MDRKKKKNIYIYIYIHTHTITHDLSLILFLSAWIMDNVTADGTFFLLLLVVAIAKSFVGKYKTRGKINTNGS